MKIEEMLEQIETNSPWIIDLASKAMTDKLNNFVRIGIFEPYMLSVNYLRQLLYDCATEIIAERVTYGIN